MGSKKDGASYWQPKPINVRAVRWEPNVDHPHVKMRCGCGKGPAKCSFCASDKPVLEYKGSRAYITRGDYIIGPDAQDQLHVFSGKEFEELYEPARASNTTTLDAMPESKWMWSTFAINSVENILSWLRMNKDAKWALQAGQAQSMYEHEKFLQQHVDAMRRAREGK